MVLSFYLVIPLLTEYFNIQTWQSLLSGGLFYIIFIYSLLDKVISNEFFANYPYLSAIHILLVCMGIAMLILNAIMVKEVSTLRGKINKLLGVLGTICNSFKKDPLACIQKIILVIGSLIFINILCNWLGVTLCRETYLSFYITLFTRLVFIKLIISLILLPFIKSKEWYNIIGMSLWLPVILIPSSLVYFYYILPFLINIQLAMIDIVEIRLSKFKQSWYEFKFAIVCIKESTFNYIKQGWISVELKTLFCIKLKSVGEYLISMGNISARLGKFWVQWANWGLDSKLKTINRKPLLPTSYTQRMFIDPLAGNLKFIPLFFGYEKYGYFPNFAVPNDWRIIPNSSLIQWAKPQWMPENNSCLTLSKDSKILIEIKLKELTKYFTKRIIHLEELSCNKYKGVNSGDFFFYRGKILLPLWIIR